MLVDIQQQRGTAARWAELNPILSDGEIGVEKGPIDEAPRIKIGDGLTAWNDLPYFGGDITWDKVTGKPVKLTEILARDFNVVQGENDESAFVITSGTGRADDEPIVSIRDDSDHGLAELISFSRDGMRVYSGTDLVAGFVNGNILGAFDQGVQAGGASMLGSNDPTEVPLSVKGMAAQSGDLQQWTNSSGMAMASLSPYGELEVETIASKYDVNGEYGYFYSSLSTDGQVFAGEGAYLEGYTTLHSRAAHHLPLTVAAAPAQTQDLTQWVNSSGQVLAKMDTYGSISVLNNVEAAQVDAEFGNFDVLSSSGPISLNDGVVTDGVGRVGIGSTEMRTDSMITLKSLYGPNTAVQILGADSGQTGPLLRIGTPTYPDLFTFDAVGRFGSGGLTLSDTNFSLKTLASNQRGIVVRGSDSQSADLQQWQGSDGSVRSRVDYYGNLITGDGQLVVGAASTSTGVRAIVHSGSASVIGMSVKGVAAQTADLQQWQNSSASVIASISATGAISNAGNITSGDRTLSTNGAFDSVNNALYLRAGAQNRSSIILNENTRADHGLPSLFQPHSSLTTPAARVPITAKGAAAQTANLTEWQNSSAGVLASISATGRFSSVGINPSSASGAGAGNAAVRAVNTGAGDSGASVRNWEGYGQDNTTITSWISTGGRMGVGGVYDVGNTVGFNFIGGSRVILSGGHLQLTNPGSGVEMRSANGTVKYITYGDDGLFNINAAPISPAWTGANSDLPMVGVRQPGGGYRSLFYGSGRLAIDVTNPNGQENWGAKEPLLVRHDGSFIAPEVAVSGNLIRAQLGSTDRFVVTKAGNMELPTANTGLILKSPNGTRYKITVADDGAVTSTAA